MVPVDVCEPFFEFSRKIVDLDYETRQLVASQLTEVNIPAKQVILSEGNPCNKIYFILSGTARSYFIDNSGITVTWSFHFNNNKSLIRNVFATDYRAFLTNVPASIAIETCTAIRALVFTKEAVHYMMEKSLNYEIWTRKIDEMAYISMFDRAFALLTMSATQRYHKLLNDESHLIQMFSSHYIASYLGIAPQSLSRIRAQN